MTALKQPALAIRLRPEGPWRLGPDSGARDRTGRILHSDTLYSAVTHAMAELGHLDAWIESTVWQSPAAVCFTSGFPWQSDTYFVPPPRTLWPPRNASPKLRWKGARFVPLPAVRELIAGEALEEDGWAIDAASECLVRVEGASAGGPCRAALRSRAAVDRLTGAVAVHRTAALEFSENAGIWTLALFRDEESKAAWQGPVEASFRLLADTGIGGERSQGWGRSAPPEFQHVTFPDWIVRVPEAEVAEGEIAGDGWWLLSLFNPGVSDSIDWTGGSYEIQERSGRVESRAGWGAEKKALRMVAEGSVLKGPEPPAGGARNVAPEGFPHPVIRFGGAVSIAIPWRDNG